MAVRLTVEQDALIRQAASAEGRRSPSSAWARFVRMLDRPVRKNAALERLLAGSDDWADDR